MGGIPAAHREERGEKSPGKPSAAGWPGSLRSLRHRDFRHFWMGLVISVMGTWMQRMAQGWLVYELTDRAIYLGLVAACGTVPMFVLTLPAGVLADRFKKRNILLVTQSLAMLQAFALAGLIYTEAIRVWHVMVCAAFLGAVWAFDMPTRHAMVLELVGKEEVLNAVSLNSGAFNVGRLAGPAIAGVLIEAAGMAGCFFVNGLTFIALLVALATIRPRPASAGTRGPVLKEIGEGLAWARGNPIAVALLGLIATTSLFALAYVVILPVFARDTFGVGALGLGFMMVAHAVGAIAAAVFLTALGHRWRLGGLATAGSFVLPLALVVVAAAPQYGLAIAGLLLVGLGMMMLSVTANAMLQKASPDELRGRVMSLRSFLFAGLSWVGDLQIGVLAEWLGPRAAVGIGAAACFAAALTVWRRAPGVRGSD